MNNSLKLSGLVLAIATINQPVHAYDTTRWNYDPVYGSWYGQTTGSYTEIYSPIVIGSGIKKETRTVNETENNSAILSRTPEQAGTIRIEPWWMGGNFQTYNYQESRKGKVEESVAVEDFNRTDNTTQIGRYQNERSTVVRSGIITRDAHTEQQFLNSGLTFINIPIGNKRRTDDTSFTFQADNIDTSPTAYQKTSDYSYVSTQYNDQQAIDHETLSSSQSKEIQNSLVYDQVGNPVQVNGKYIFQKISEDIYDSKSRNYRTGKSALSSESESGDTHVEQSTDFYYKRNSNGSLVLGANGQPIVLVADQTADGKLRQQNQYIEQWNVNGGSNYNVITTPILSRSVATTRSSYDKDSVYQPNEVLKRVNEQKRSNKAVTTDILDGFQSLNQSSYSSKATDYNPDNLSNDIAYERENSESSAVKYRTFKTDSNGTLITANGQPVQDIVYSDSTITTRQNSVYKQGQLSGTLKSQTETLKHEGSKEYSDGFKGSYKKVNSSSAEYANNLGKDIEVNRIITVKNSLDSKDKLSTEVSSKVIKPGSIASGIYGQDVTGQYPYSFTDQNGNKKYYVSLGYDSQGNEIRSEVQVDVNTAKINEVVQYKNAKQSTEKVSLGETVAYSKTNQNSSNRTITNIDDGFVAYDRDTDSDSTTIYSTGKHEFNYQHQINNKSDDYNRTYKLDSNGNKVVKDGKLIVDSVNHNVSETAVQSKNYQEGQAKKSDTSYSSKTSRIATDAQDGFVSIDNSTSNSSTVEFNKGKSTKYSTNKQSQTSQKTSRSYQKDEDGGEILVNGQPVIEKTIQSSSSSSLTGNQYQLGQSLKSDQHTTLVANTKTQNILAKTTEVATSSTNVTDKQYRQGQSLDTYKLTKTQTGSELTNADSSSRDYQKSSTTEQKRYQTELGLLATQKTSQFTKTENTESLTVKNAQGTVTTQQSIQRGSERISNSDNSAVLNRYGTEKSTNNQGISTEITGREIVNTNKFGLTDSNERQRVQMVKQANGVTEKVTDQTVQAIDQLTLNQNTEKNGQSSQHTTSITAQGITTTGKITASGGIDAAGAVVANVKTAVADSDGVNLAQLKQANAATVTSSSAYTDTSSAATLATAKMYSDTTNATTLSSSRTYTDTSSAATLAAAKSYTDNSYQHLNHKLDNVEKSAYRGVAISLAAQQTVPNMKPGNVALYGGLGHYQGESAVSLGFTSLMDNGRTSVSAAFGLADSEIGGRVGVAYVFGE